MLLFIVGIGSALAAEEGAEATVSLPPEASTLAELAESGETQIEQTDPEAATGDPREGLGREEAVEMMAGVFEPELQGSAGVFAGLEVERFLSPTVAVVPGEGPPVAAPSQSNDLLPPEDQEPAPLPPGKTEQPGLIDGATLLNSTIPLETGDASGKPEAVDLELEHSEGELQASNPLVEVGIPDQLGEGIELPDAGVSVELAGAPEERVPSTIDGSVAIYPNVARDTDLAVAPTPTGFETLTQIRSTAAPRTETFELGLPSGASIEETRDGGAAVTEGGRILLGVDSPTAIDSQGASVPVTLEVSGDALVLTVHPEPATAYPILVDPLYQVYVWAGSNPERNGICWSAKPTGNCAPPREEWASETHVTNSREFTAEDIWGVESTEIPANQPGLVVKAWGQYRPGDWAQWSYTVPRYYSQQEEGRGIPTSFIGHMTLSDLLWEALSPNPSPNMYAYIGLVEGGWVSSYSHSAQYEHGLKNLSYPYEFVNANANGEPNTNAKLAYVGISANEVEEVGAADLYVGDATIELGDKGAPQLAVPATPSPWLNQANRQVEFTAGDTGLGVYSVTAQEGANQWVARNGCLGVGNSACPLTWGSKEPAHPTLTIEASKLSTGIHYPTLTATDPVGNTSVPSYAEVKVDHTAPEVTLSGALTEQATLGTRRAAYPLRVAVHDGTEAAPQSGVAKVEVMVDGKAVTLPEQTEWEPKCQTQNCAFAGEWSMGAPEYGAGSHEVKVVATDAVGNTTTKILQVELHPTPPTLSVSGTMTEQASLGTERPSYALHVSASSMMESPTPATTPIYSTSFGTSGTGSGQLSHPGDIAIGTEGSLWVVDTGNNRIERFNEKGEYLSQFGTKGSGAGQLNRPTAIAVAASGNLWVTDSGNRRVEEFSPTGAYLAQFGSAGTGGGQFAGAGPEGIAIDYHGNIWVSDTYGGRLEKFTESGTFVRSVATRGTGAGQLLEPTGIEIGPGGNVFVTDWGNGKVAEYGEGGAFVRQFGSVGTEAGALEGPTGIAIDSKGDVWVGDERNGRVEEFNQGGEYIGRFGTAGTGAGQFSLGYPAGIATDSRGDIWVTDGKDNRVEKWISGNYSSTTTPAYTAAIGTYGTTAGHLNRPTGVAVDAKGNLWTSDIADNLIEKWGPKGEFLASYGSAGSGAGQLSSPLGLTVAGGHVWVSDTGNNRVEEFSEAGAYMAKFGSAGSGAGQLNYPGPPAIDAGHHVWVPDEGNNRLEEFTEAGAYVRSIGTSGAGKLNDPQDVAVGPNNRLYVADYYDNRIAEYNEAGEYLGQVGGGSAEVGQLSEPIGVWVDKSEDVWVVERGNNRVKEFGPEGAYLGEFASTGSGAGQLSAPVSIAGDEAGHLFVADMNDSRISEWTRQTTHSQVSTEVTIDGRRKEAHEASCEAKTCPTSYEWTLPSSSLAAGAHEVRITATDGLGNTTTKTLSIRTGDSMKPGLEVGGELVAAPEGWIEQAGGNYGLHATATDSGYGVTSLKFSLGGKVAAEKTQGCAAGACSATISTTVNARTLTAGAQEAEVVATDGAGNTTTRRWTVNVDPSGRITSVEAEKTLEAADETSGSATVAPTGEILSPEQISEGDNPGLKQNESKIASTGVPDETTLSTELSKGFTIQDPEGTATITPVVSESATKTTISEGVAAVAADTGSEVDSIVRPEYDGAETFQAIRSATAPETYSWTVNLQGGQTLRLANSTQAEVLFSSGHLAYLITAEKAHDATGAAVATSLSVSGNVLTLKVAFRSGTFVYPIIAGQGWEGGYFVPVIVEGPEDEMQIREREEREREEREWIEQEEAGGSPGEGGEDGWGTEGSNYIPPPPYSHSQAMRFVALTGGGDHDLQATPRPAPPGAGMPPGTIVNTLYRSKCGYSCEWFKAKVYNASYFTGSGHGWSQWENGTQVHASVEQAPAFVPLINTTTWNCGWAGPYHVKEGSNEHLEAFAHFTIEFFWLPPVSDSMFPAEANWDFRAWVYPNGFQSKHVKKNWDGEPNNEHCPTTISY